MTKRGWGRIVNIASVAGKEGNPNASAYSASKAGVIGLTKSLGKELATTGVLVNCVAPAVVKTELFSQMTEQHINYMLSKIPMNRFGEVDEVAEMVAWLASSHCTFATGASFRSLRRTRNLLKATSDMTLHTLTLTELAAGLAAKKFSSREIVDALLGRIAKANGKLHAFTEVYAKDAKALADAADTARASGFPLGAPARPADRLQGSLRHRRPHRHRRLEDVREAASPPRPPTPSSASPPPAWSRSASCTWSNSPSAAGAPIP